MREPFNKASANVYDNRIVCGKCGFMVATYKEKPKENGDSGIVTVLCRRRNENGEPCNTINEIKV